MTILLVVLFTVMAAIAQSQLPTPAFLGHVKWPCLPAVVLYFALHRNLDVAVTVAILAGMMQDALGLMPLGLSVLCFVFVAMVTARFRNVVMPDAVLTTTIFGALTCTIWVIVCYAVLRSRGWYWPFSRLLSMLLGTTVLGAITTPVFHRLIGGLDRLVVRREQPDLPHEIY
ncbi:MAG: hypothetical protein N2255_09745 [Kiritimatiellae bacterium]|nr:hypothetical protein [Kiritimatiellia bacterium]